MIIIHINVFKILSFEGNAIILIFLQNSSNRSWNSTFSRNSKENKLAFMKKLYALLGNNK
jgi:hypothetical protein